MKDIFTIIAQAQKERKEAKAPDLDYDKSYWRTKSLLMREIKVFKGIEYITYLNYRTDSR